MFPGKVGDSGFVNPLLNDPLGVQFVNENGHSLLPVNNDPASYVVAKSLAGPFYQLEVFGLAFLMVKPRLSRYKMVRILCRDASGQDYLSSPLFFNVPIHTLKDLGLKLGIKWYSVDVKAFPKIHYTEFPSLEKCIEHERTETGSIQSN